MENKRVYYLDILRILATLGVLFNHIPLAALHIFDAQATDVDRFIVNGNVHVMHFAVPIFVMITGALLLQPERKIDYHKVLTKYVWRMVVILALVGSFFAWMELFFAEKHFALSQIPRAMFNTLGGHSWKHMWYLYMLIGLYLITPLLKAAVNTMGRRELDWLILIGLLFTSVVPAIEEYANLEVGIKFPIVSQYVFLMLLGYRLGGLKLASSKIWIGLAVCLGIVYMSFGYSEYMLGHKTTIWLSGYESPLMILYSVCIFIAVKESRCDWQPFILNGGGHLFA